MAPRRLSLLRRATFFLAEQLAARLGGRRLYRWCCLSEGRLRVRRETIEVAGLPPSLEGLSVLHMSDVHGGLFLGEGDLDHASELVRHLEPDFVCWTGDYIVRRPAEIAGVLPALRRCTGLLGTFAVFGNHDYKERREGEIAAALAESGWTFLRNECVQLEVRGERVAVGGIEDLEEGRGVDVAEATRCFASSALCVGLSHGPQAAPEFARCGAHVVLSGHSHGTQVDLPLLRELGPAHPGLRVELGATALIVNRGLGVIGAPVRVGAPAEVVLLTFRRPAGGHSP